MVFSDTTYQREPGALRHRRAADPAPLPIHAMQAESALIAENIAVLRQGVDLLAALSPEVYARQGRFDARSGVGAHVRHCIEFYAAFLEGVATGRIDYGDRARDVRLEHDLGCARERLCTIADALLRLDECALRASVLVRAEGDAARDVWSASSIGRELQALSSHTVHHFALIAILLRFEGIETPETFGVAPSTLAYWRAPTCAR